MLQGITLFAGDSMTVGVPSQVPTSGENRMDAAVNRTTGQLLQALSSNPTEFQGAQRMVVLIGANDLNSSASVDSLFQAIQSIWGLGKSKGLKVIALTIPPNLGWSGFQSNFTSVNVRRNALNALIKSSKIPDQVIDASALMADPENPDKLSSTFDSGDHLHPKKAAMGALIASQIASPSSSLPAAGSGVVASLSSTPSGISLPLTTVAVWLLILSAVGLGISKVSRLPSRTS